ncbi:MAG: cobalamin biosynthesis protein [Peptococcaceae bacterium]|nr:cobalamin biosynthesis protein [Peptococcaceae bacterium]
MKAAVLALTPGGAELASRLEPCLAGAGYDPVLYLPERLAGGGTAVPFSHPLRELVAGLFPESRALVLVMALGIAVRLLAPCLRDKRTDPAVVVLDEKGEYAVSVLSGHLGGANDLARLLAAFTGGRAVVTTATDVLGLLAPDVLARRFSLVPDPFDAVKPVNAALAGGETVPVYSEVALPAEEGLLWRPWEARDEAGYNWRVLVTDRSGEEGPGILCLRPRRLVAGVGTRSGIGPEKVLEALAAAFQLAGRSMAALSALATADLKAGEPGLVTAAARLGVPLYAYPRTRLREAIDGAGLACSALVEGKIGVGGVCEPASICAAGTTRLILPKTARDGVTVALAEAAWP